MLGSKSRQVRHALSLRRPSTNHRLAQWLDDQRKGVLFTRRLFLALFFLFVGLKFREYLLCVFPIDLEETPSAPPYSSYSHHLNVNRLSGGGLNHGRRLVLGARFDFVFPWFNGVRKPATVG